MGKLKLFRSDGRKLLLRHGGLASSLDAVPGSHILGITKSTYVPGGLQCRKAGYLPKIYFPVMELENGVAITLDTNRPLPFQYLGDTVFSGSSARETTLAFNLDNTPYVSFMDDAYAGKTSVMVFGDKRWQYVGQPGFSTSPPESIQLVLGGGSQFFIRNYYVVPFTLWSKDLWRFDGSTRKDTISLYDKDTINLVEGSGTRSGAIKASSKTDELFTECSPGQNWASTSLFKLNANGWSACTPPVNMDALDGSLGNWFMDKHDAVYFSSTGPFCGKSVRYSLDKGWQPSPAFTVTFVFASNIVQAFDGSAFAMGHLPIGIPVFGLYRRTDLGEAPLQNLRDPASSNSRTLPGLRPKRYPLNRLW